MGKQAPGTTTIGFNAPTEEKRILKQLVKDKKLRGHSEVVRDGYLEWMRGVHPEYAKAIEFAREVHRIASMQRSADGAQKRTGNIRKAQAANAVGDSVSRMREKILSEGLSGGGLTPPKTEVVPKPLPKRRPKRGGGGKTKKKGQQ